MRLKRLGMAAVLALGGCWTPDDVKQTGIVWNGTYSARYEQLARCLSAQTTLYYKAILQLDANERRARVTYAIPVTGIPVEVYDVRQTSNDVVDVSWSTRLERGHVNYGPLYLMRVCGATPISAPPPPAPTPPQPPAWAPEPTTTTYVPSNR